MAFVGTPLCVRVRGARPPTARAVTRRPVPAGHPTRASSRMSISENTSAAGSTPTVGPPAAVVTSASVSDEDVGNRSFQLIEMEDSEQAVSALYFRAEDHGVDFGATDGPVPDSVTGEWVLHGDDGTLGLSLTRKYEGDFSFEVTRFYKVRLSGCALLGRRKGGLWRSPG